MATTRNSSKPALAVGRGDPGSVLGMSHATDAEARGAVRRGYPFRALDEVSKRLARPSHEINAVLGIPPRTFARRKAAKQFTPEESDRIYRLARTVHLALDVLGSDEKARNWLKAPNRALGGEVPFELLDTDIGARQVEAVLLRVAYGIFS
jgi:putative toxin-antitoxin system antitoxin component (TIGR02293 family)